SPGARALSAWVRVASQRPSSGAAVAGIASPSVTASVARSGTMTLAPRDPLWRRKFKRILASVFDVPDDVGSHAAGAYRRNLHLRSGERRLEHLVVPEIQRHVLAAAGTVEDDVAAAHLRRRDLAAHVVLRTRVVRELDPDTCEGVKDQARAVESDCARTRIDALTRPCGVAATPRI